MQQTSHTSSGNFDPSALKGLGIKPLASFLAHRRAALIAFVVIVLLGIPVAWLKGVPKYMATATVQVAPRYMKNLKEDPELDFQSNSQYRQFVENQARSVPRYDIVETALNNLGERRKFWQLPKETDRRAIERLQAALIVVPVADTYLMQISLDGGKKEGLAEIVNAVVDAYIARMRIEQVFGSDDRLKNLDAREKQLLAVIDAKTKRRTQLALELGVTAFKDGDGNPYDKLLASTGLALNDARNARFAAESKLNAFKASGETDLTTRSIQENVLTDPGLNSLKGGLNGRRAGLVTIMSGLTPQHPAYLAAKQELTEIDLEIARQTEQLTRSVGASLRQRYEMTADQARGYEADLARTLAEQEKQSARFAVSYNEALTLTSEVEQTRKELDTVRERLNFFAAEAGALGFVRPVTPALPPEIPFGPGRKKLLMMVLAAALLGALIVPIGIDLSDGRVRTVNDAERILMLPSLGWIIETGSDAARLFADDQLRRIAGGLIRDQERNNVCIFGLCGVKPGAGATQLALTLARTLDRLGYPTLVVEANAFRPDARFRDGEARPGFHDALTERADAFDCIIPASGELPARVGIGGSGSSGSGQLERIDRVRPVLEGYSRDFRFVLVDTPPLLLSADAEILLGRLGQILLVVEAGGVTRGELQRAGRLLDKIGAQAVGLIVNRVRPIAGGGYLQGLMIEFLTHRKLAEFETGSLWALRLRMQWADFVQGVTRPARRIGARIGALAKRVRRGPSQPPE